MFAVTERLLLRPGWTEDAPALSRAIGDAAVVRNLSRAPWPYALGDAENFLSQPQDPRYPRFLVTRRDDGALIGGIALMPVEGEGAELGYWLARDQWGRGYATEAGRAVVAIADESLRLPELKASHALDNPASGGVLAKLGFEPNGTAKLYSRARGRDMDIRTFVRTRPMGEPQALAA
ncbi:RimJ/RimL family protein N-acetyltransferase [Sphingomonas vulcanisoli]|uniref:RimJ/RimL family protein N-acetyltransferase n=1 Tax=Sphingomonas vulcanisoli TaxID=1658060 RepID=A0ABX0TPQ3_9SPHN|nr:GNAT family N-acetyltransferase [Sphingomonas vulcanisoli]NIJ07487.1 RimJ/RimL family protein N-acetyltransferase [Sphingomonas vulcanisoli]